MSTDASWSVYILKCADGTLYTGITPDLPRRLATHETGKGAKYTKGRGPFEMIFSESHPNKSSAARREAEIKSLNRNQKLNLVAQKLEN